MIYELEIKILENKKKISQVLVMNWAINMTAVQLYILLQNCFQAYQTQHTFNLEFNLDLAINGNNIGYRDIILILEKLLSVTVSKVFNYKIKQQALKSV